MAPPCEKRRCQTEKLDGVWPSAGRREELETPELLAGCLATLGRGYRISEVPVDWIEDLDSRVDVAATALKDVKGLLRVREERLRRWFHGRRKRSAGQEEPSP